MALGKHILAEIVEVSAEILNDPGHLERRLVEAAKTSGATVVESSFNPFVPHGVTGFVIIQESHLAVHTWPEHGYAALDVFTCSPSISPADIARSFADAVDGHVSDLREIDRGTDYAFSSTSSAGSGAASRSIWFTDRQDNIALSLKHAGVLFSETSAYQKVEVLYSVGYGRILLLNDSVAFTERDEFVYHELITHIPATHHPNPKRILVVGGGDGGACREFLKHGSIEAISVVELDPTVTEAARDHFSNMSASLDDPRVTLVHGDGDAYLSSTSDTFDVIAIDCLDSAGDAFSETFLETAKSALAPGGLLVSQIWPPTLPDDRYVSDLGRYRAVFEEVRPYLGHLPTYSSGTVSFVLCGDDIGSPAELPAPSSLRYVNQNILEAVFSIPTFAQNRED
ncbi:MAG: adenosylmethionine decarboxylase [Gemmatimonadetes bacterium]|nr:adenosylmethionine decarboxylase [Gemmatimonadota bacterium]